jgi:hypothetical protein
MRSTLGNLAVFGLAMTGGWILGCSGGGGTDPEVPPNGGTILPAQPSPSASSSSSGSTSSGTSPSSSSGGTGNTTVDQCVAACEAKYPKGAQLGKAIDTCWQNNCDACLAMGKGAPQGPENGSCKTDVYTPSGACSQCTVDSCCAAWDACFGNADCVALNKCSVACYQ